MTVTYRGDGVAGTQVTANGDRAGTTDGDGTLSLDLDEGASELELGFRRGELEFARTYRVENGTLAPVDRETATARATVTARAPETATFTVYERG